MSTHTPYAVDAIPTPMRMVKTVEMRERDSPLVQEDDVVANVLCDTDMRMAGVRAID